MLVDLSHQLISYGPSWQSLQEATDDSPIGPSPPLFAEITRACFITRNSFIIVNSLVIVNSFIILNSFFFFAYHPDFDATLVSAAAAKKHDKPSTRRRPTTASKKKALSTDFGMGHRAYESPNYIEDCVSQNVV